MELQLQIGQPITSISGPPIKKKEGNQSQQVFWRVQ